MALGAAVQEPDLTATYERQERIGYRSDLIVGERAVDDYMKTLFPDWRARGVTVCLHEKQGGFAFNIDSVLGLVGKCESEGVAILSGVEVEGLELGSDHRQPFRLEAAKHTAAATGDDRRRNPRPGDTGGAHAALTLALGARTRPAPARAGPCRSSSRPASQGRPSLSWLPGRAYGRNGRRTVSAVDPPPAP